MPAEQKWQYSVRGIANAAEISRQAVRKSVHDGILDPAGLRSVSLFIVRHLMKQYDLKGRKNGEDNQGAVQEFQERVSKATELFGP